MIHRWNEMVEDEVESELRRRKKSRRCTSCFITTCARISPELLRNYQGIWYGQFHEATFAFNDCLIMKLEQAKDI